MLGLTRQLCFSLILATGFLASFTRIAGGQSPDTRPRGTASISGKVTIGHKPAPGVTVAVFGNDSFNRRPIAQTISDSEGRYSLFGLAGAQYQVTALAPSFTPAEAPTNSFQGSYYGWGKAVVLSAAESAEDVDIKLVRGAVVTGRVTGSDGKPVVDERVSVQMIDSNGAPTRQQAIFPSNYQIYQTDDRGVYRIFGLPAGRYKVSVGNDPNWGAINPSSRSYFTQTYHPDVTDPAKAIIVELSEGSEAANIDIQVGRRAETYAASGRIVDADTGQPVAGIRFSYGAVQKNQPFYGGYVGPMTNSRGEFRIEGLEPGRYGVNVASGMDAGNSYGDPVLFEVVNTNVTNLEVKAIRGLSLSGVVVLEGVTDKDVLSQLTNLRISASVASDKKPQTYNGGTSSVAGDGSFQINGLRPGKANFYIYSQVNPNVRNFTIARIERDGVDQTQSLEIQTGQSLSGLRVLVVYGSGAIRGVVKFEGGVLPPGTRMFIRAQREGTSVSNLGAQADSRGHFLMSNLVAGTYELTLQVLAPASIPRAQRPPQPLKQFVTVMDNAEAEVMFVVDLKPKEGGP